MPRHHAGGLRKGVLFDVDGTLIDSAYLHTLAWWQAFRQAGFDVPMAHIHRHVGMGGARLVDSLLPEGRPCRNFWHFLAFPEAAGRCTGSAGPVLRRRPGGGTGVLGQGRRP